MRQFQGRLFSNAAFRECRKSTGRCWFPSDSSVSKGIKANDNLRVLDYSSAVSKYRPWKISKQDICNSDESGKIYEFPILTERHLIKKIINKISKLIIKNKKKNSSEIISDLITNLVKGSR